MRLSHCPRDGSLLVYDAGQWQCLWCSYSVEPLEESRHHVWQWPPELRPLHARHSYVKHNQDDLDYGT